MVINSALFEVHSQNESTSFQREIYFTGYAPVREHQLRSNSVATNPSAIIGSLPLAIFSHFKRGAIIWYLTISLLSLGMPNEQSGIYCRILPLCFVLASIIVKEFFITWKKLRNVHSEDDLITNLWCEGDFVKTKWKDIRPGHIFSLYEGEIAPVDMILVTTSNLNKPAFFDTTAVTGNKSTQEFFPVKEMHINFSLLEPENLEEIYPSVFRLAGKIQVNQPSPDLGSFRGRLHMENSPTMVYLKPKHFVPRGFVLKNTKWVLGIAVYTGFDTKIWQSFTDARVPEGLFTKLNNKFSVRIGLFTLLLSMVGFMCSFRLSSLNESFQGGMVHSLMIFTVFMPISYILIIDLLKYFMSNEDILKDMNCQVNRSERLEALGCLDYVFTGMTNCVTNGTKEIQNLVIGTKIYKNDSNITDNQSVMYESMDLDFKDLFHELSNKDDELTDHFFKCMVLCSSSSQENDEAFILSLAKQLGCYLEYMDDDTACVFFKGSCDYSVEAVLHPKPSTRRTRILLKDLNTSKYVLYVKGESDAMLNILKLSKKVKMKIKHILRTELLGNQHVILGFKVFSQQEVKDFFAAYKMARLSPINKEARIETVFSEYEASLQYAGIIGIEHKISPKTTKCIKKLKKSGIKFWMLTGETESSALSAAMKSQIVPSDHSLLYINDIENEHECQHKLENIMNSILNQNMEHSSSSEEESYEMEFTQKSSKGILTMALRQLQTAFVELQPMSIELNKPISLSDMYSISLAIEGQSLHFALRTQQTRKLLVVMLNIARSVVFYKLLPYQKKQITRLVKRNFTRRCHILAVGGEEQDLSMLLEADISVSLKRSMNGDIFVSDMSKLEYIILCLGHSAFLNIARVTSFSVYFSFAIGVTNFTYVFYSDFSVVGILPCQYEFLMIYFLLFLPAVSIGTWDQDRGMLELMKKEHIYRSVKKIMKFFTKILFENALQGILHGLVSIYISMEYTSMSIYPDGKVTDGYFLSNLVLLSLYMTCMCTLFYNTFKKDMKTMSGFFLSFIIFLFYLLCLPLFPYDLYLEEAFLNPSMFIALFLIVLTNLFISILYSYAGVLVYKHNVKDSVILDEAKIMSYFKDSDNWARAEEKLNFELKTHSLQFFSLEKEKNYFMTKLYKLHGVYSSYYIFLFFYFLLEFACLITFDDDINNPLALALCILPTLALYIWVSRTSVFLNHYKKITMSYLILLKGIAIAMTFLYEDISNIILIGILSFLLLAYNLDWFNCSVSICLLALIIIVKMFLFIDTIRPEPFAYALGTLLICLIISYRLELTYRNEFIMTQKLEHEAEKVHSVLSCLLPAFVRKRVKNGVRYIAEDQGTVTVIFCNICDFIDVIKDFSPQELTCFLDEVFRKFDHLCESVGVTKVETVGSTYMACAGLRDSDAEVSEEYRKISHARRAIEFGLLLLGTINDILLPTGKALTVKIGIHSGPVAAGVVGSHKPQFSLVGDTVNTASRMATTLTECNCIQFSSATKDLIEEKQGLIYIEKCIEVKGKGKMIVYKMSLSNLLADDLSPYINSPTRLNRLMTKKSFSNFGQDFLLRRSTVFALADVSCTREFMNLKGSFSLFSRYSCLGLRIRYSNKDENFRAKNILNIYPIFFAGVSIKAVVLIVQCISLAVEEKFSLLGLSSLVLFAYSGMALLMKRYNKYLQFAWMLQILNMADMLASIYIHSLRDTLDVVEIVLIMTFNIVLLSQCSLLLFNESAYTSVIASVAWMIPVLRMEDEMALASSCAVLFHLIAMLGLLHSRESKLRFYAKFEYTGHKEIQETETLLSKMFPPQIYNELKNDTIGVNNFYGVTILYADIVGFTEWSSSKSPSEVVDMLSELFTRFDHSCELHRVYKVHTIGDCYVVMGYDSTDGHRDPGQEALRMVDFARSLIHLVQEVNREYDLKLDMRIGMHTGDVIGGITGSNLVRYDVYGLDVLIANKIESYGLPGKISVSNHTKELLEQYRKSKFNFEKIRKFTLHNSDVKVYKLIDANDIY